MKRKAEMFIAFVACLTIATPTLTLASSSPRLIPTGTVSLLSEGKKVDQFKSEMPLPEGLLAVESGTCMVQADGLQVVAQEHTVFGLADAKQGWDATVQSGRVDFAMAAGVKSVIFHTPHDTLQAVRAEDAGEGVIRGFVTVNKKGTELTVLEGNLQVASKEGSKLVKAGQTVMLAGVAGAAGVAAAGAGASGTAVAGGVGVAAVVGGAAAVALSAGGDTVTPTGRDVSPF